MQLIKYRAFIPPPTDEGLELGRVELRLFLSPLDEDDDVVDAVDFLSLETALFCNEAETTPPLGVFINVTGEKEIRGLRRLCCCKAV